MKKILFLFTFLLCAGMMTAQDAAAKESCSKKCAKTCASKKASADASADAETKVASAESAAVLVAADLAAADDEAIEKKVCDVTGSVSYFRKSTCEVSGSTKMTEVSYDKETKAFVNVSPRDVMADMDAKVVKTGATEKKACASKAKGKACCASKKKAGA